MARAEPLYQPEVATLASPSPPLARSYRPRLPVYFHSLSLLPTCHRCLLPLRKPSTRFGVAVDGGGDVVGLVDDCTGGDSDKGEGVDSINLRSCVNSSYKGR
jgi:hypothetical protein